MIREHGSRQGCYLTYLGHMALQMLLLYILRCIVAEGVQDKEVRIQQERSVGRIAILSTMQGQ